MPKQLFKSTIGGKILERFQSLKFAKVAVFVAVLVIAGVTVKLVSSAATANPYASRCPTPHQTVSQGSSGYCVRYLQWSLNQPGGGSHGLSIDGSFGPLTKSAVISFQGSHRDWNGVVLLKDGIVGSRTWWALDKAVPPAGTATPIPTGFATMVRFDSNASRLELSACTSGGTKLVNGVPVLSEVGFQVKSYSDSNEINWVRVYRNGTLVYDFVPSPLTYPFLARSSAVYIAKDQPVNANYEFWAGIEKHPFNFSAGLPQCQ